MAAITWSDVTDLDSSLSALSVALQATILGIVNTRFDVSLFDGEDGPTTKLLRQLFAAHMGTVLKPGAGATGAAGPVTSEAAGGLSRSYAVAGAGNMQSSALGRTGFGQTLDLLIQTSAARAPIVVP